MSWTLPKVWNVGDLLTASDMNAQVSGNTSLVWHEVAYNEFTSPVSVTGTTEATATTVVTASSVVFDGLHVALIEFWCPAAARGTNWIQFALYDGSSSIGGVLEPLGYTGSATLPPVPLKRRLTPAAATKTYSIRAFVDAGTGSVKAGAGGTGADLPGYIRVLQQG